MARPAPPTGTLRAAVDGTVLGHAFTNVFWARLTDDGTRTINDLATILDGIATAYGAHLMAHISSQVVCGVVDGVWQTGASTVLADARAFTHTGISGAAINDAAASYCIGWKIGARYRGGKPRTYLPGPIEGNVLNGSDLQSAQVTALAADAVAFMAAVNALTAVHVSAVELGTVSFFTAGGSETVPPTYRTPPVFEPFIGSSVNTKLCSQRRRIRS